MNTDEERIRSVIHPRLSVVYLLMNYAVVVVLRCSVTIPIRFQHNLDTVVFLLLEDVVSVRCIVKTHRVCDDKRRIDVAVLDHL